MKKLFLILTSITFLTSFLNAKSAMDYIYDKEEILSKRLAFIKTIKTNFLELEYQLPYISDKEIKEFRITIKSSANYKLYNTPKGSTILVLPVISEINFYCDEIINSINSSNKKLEIYNWIKLSNTLINGLGYIDDNINIFNVLPKKTSLYSDGNMNFVGREIVNGILYIVSEEYKTFYLKE